MGPTKAFLLELLSEKVYSVYEQINTFILDNYNVDLLWDKGGKYGELCLRYSRSSKTLCTLYFRKEQLGIWFIFGKEEREKFEREHENFSQSVIDKYNQTAIFHDGKWLMFDVEDNDLLDDFVKLLKIKKKPNRQFTMCGYCCDMCKAYKANIKKKDQREELSRAWNTYYKLDIASTSIQCDGCRCMKADAHRIDNDCPVRACVLQRKINHCSDCDEYPCTLFFTRKGLSYEEANQIKEIDITDYTNYLMAFDNKSRLDRLRNNK